MDEQLIAAIATQNLEQVEALLAAGANPNARQGDKTAYQLVPHGAYDIKCALIEAGAEDPELKHALVWAIGTGRVEAVRVLIQQRSDVDVSTYSGTPIQVAARDGHTEIVDLLLAAGADVDAGSSISTPLLNAIEHGHTDIALKLIAAGADPNRTPQFGNTPPIAVAAAQGSPDIIRALVAAGADVNARVAQIVLNRLAIQQQAAAGLQSAFEAMAAFGKMMESLEDLDDDDQIDRDRMSDLQDEIAEIELAAAQRATRSTEPETAVDTFPVIITARCGHAEALAVLLEAGADPHRKDGEGLSAYDWAVRNEHPNAIALLQQFGVTGTRTDVNETLLLAAAAGDLATVQDCLRQGADANARDARRQTRDKTALMLAATAGHLAVVQALLNAGADPDLTDQGADAQPVSKALLEHADPETILKNLGYRFGRTALMEAAATGKAEVVQALLQAGANPNLQDAVDYTALALAAENGHLPVVEALINAGAAVNQAVAYGNTPFMLACANGAVDVAEYLVDHGADVTITNDDRQTALMKAAAVASLPLVRLCIEHGVDVNTISRDRETALGIAARASRYVETGKNDPGSGSGIREYRDDGSCWEDQPFPEAQIIDVVQALLQAGADPNIANCETTPLIEAARNGHLRLLQVLLEAGARLDVRDRSGDTAASMAKLYNQRAILSFLRDYAGTDLSEFESKDDDDAYEDDEERWGEELPQPDFSAVAQSPDYQQAVQELAEHCGGAPISNDEVPGWFSIHVNSKRRPYIDTEELQRQFAERGCFIYEPDHYYGDGPEKLCIIPTTDKYDVIALHQTNGCNCGIGPGYVVEWLRGLEAEQPFVLTCIAHDTLAGRFLTPVAEPERWAERMYDFCPDIVDQGCGSVERLAESLAASDNLFFWWD